MAKQKTLGRGIDALFSSQKVQVDAKIEETYANITKHKKIIEVEISKLEINPFQPRTQFNQSRLEELAKSIEEHGILEPLLVEMIESSSNKKDYMLIAGERRFRAAQICGLQTVPCIVLTVSDEQKLEIAIVENLQRENLNPIELAISFKEMMKVSKVSQEELAQKLHISRPVVSNAIRLLTLSEEIQQAIIEEKITQSHARLLLSIESNEDRKKLFQNIINEKLSVKQVEKKIGKKTQHSKISNKALVIYEEKLIDFFGTKVQIAGNIQKGTISINYYNQEDFSRILDLLHITIE